MPVAESSPPADRPPGAQRRSARPVALALLSFAALLAAVIFVANSGANQLPVDGRSNLPGNLASLQYTPFGDQRESALDTNDGDGETTVRTEHSGAYWMVSRAEGGNERSKMVLTHIPFDFRKRTLAGVIAFKEAQNSRQAGYQVQFEREKIDGRAAFTMEYITDGGWRMSRVWVFGPKHSYRVFCNYPPSASEELFDQCVKASKTLRIHDGTSRSF